MEKRVFGPPAALTGAPTHYCHGCSHGVAHRLLAEVIDEMDIQSRTIAVGSIGCSALADFYFALDMVMALHGRAPATATGVKRVRPDKLVFTYQGDGALAAIGAAEMLHAAARGENISVFFVNNAVYGMTGGQMAPTSLPGQVTRTSPAGRAPELAGHPIKGAELLAALEGPAFISRVSLHSPQAITQAKRAVRRAFETQEQKLGFSLVEMLAICPVNWRMTPRQACAWVENTLIPFYPLGVFRDVAGKDKAKGAAA